MSCGYRNAGAQRVFYSLPRSGFSDGAFGHREIARTAFAFPLPSAHHAVLLGQPSSWSFGRRVDQRHDVRRLGFAVVPCGRVLTWPMPHPSFIRTRRSMGAGDHQRSYHAAGMGQLRQPLIYFAFGALGGSLWSL